MEFKYYIEYQSLDGKLHFTDMCDLRDTIQKLDDVYRISITQIRVFKHKLKKEFFDFYVADEIKSISQYGARLRQITGNFAQLYYPDVGPNDATRPAAINNIIDSISLNLGTVVHKYVYWKPLNPKHDIVINRNLNQIYPIKTGNKPMLLKKLMEKAR